MSASGILEEQTKKIHKTLYSDFKKSVPETDLMEIFVVTTELNHAISHLKRWMKPKQVSPTVSEEVSCDALRVLLVYGKVKMQAR
ncbi:MAG: hypothetical protein AAF518_27150 [Spirochaetota bacterium]